MDTLLIIASFTAGVLADHFLESKIRARVSDGVAAAKAEAEKVKAIIAEKP